MGITIIGNGIAGNSAAMAIRSVNKEVPVTIISEEAFPLYSNCVLSKKYISKEVEREKVFLKSFEDYSKESIETIFGRRVEEIDIRSKRLLLNGKKVIYYDKLIIATGSKPIIPSIKGVDKENVFVLKSLNDADKIHNYVGEKVVVVGAGPLGVEACVALRKRCFKVFLIVRSRLLRRMLDKEVSMIIEKILKENGIKVLAEEKLVKFGGTSQVDSIITSKYKIACDAVILALGLEPRVELARRAGIRIGELGGIKVNERMMTSVKDVYACGDCVEVKDILSGKDALRASWYNAKQQGRIAGYNSIGVERSYAGMLGINVIDVFGTYVVSIGYNMDRLKDVDVKVVEEKDKYHYCRLLVNANNGVIMGAQFIGEPRDLGVLINAIRRKDSLKKLQEALNNKDLLFRNPWNYGMHQYVKLGVV